MFKWLKKKVLAVTQGIIPKANRVLDIPLKFFVIAFVDKTLMENVMAREFLSFKDTKMVAQRLVKMNDEESERRAILQDAMPHDKLMKEMRTSRKPSEFQSHIGFIN